MRKVSLGIPKNSLGGASSAIPFPSTPRLAHARLALVGPRSGPPCFRDPPTIVGAISSAALRQALAPLQPFAAIRSNRTSPTVRGGVRERLGHVKCAA